MPFYKSGNIVLPRLKKLRHPNAYAPLQHYSVRHAPIIRFNVESQPFEDTPIFINNVLVRINQEERIQYSHKKGHGLGTVTRGISLNLATTVDVQLHSNQYSLENPYGTKTKVTIKPKPSYWKAEDADMAILRLPTRSTGMGASTSPSVEAEVSMELGWNSSPSGNHGTVFYFITLPAKVTIHRVSNKGNASTTVYELKNPGDVLENWYSLL